MRKKIYILVVPVNWTKATFTSSITITLLIIDYLLIIVYISTHWYYKRKIFLEKDIHIRFGPDTDPLQMIGFHKHNGARIYLHDPLASLRRNKRWKHSHITKLLDCIQISLRETITSLHARLKDQNYRLVLFQSYNSLAIIWQRKDTIFFQLISFTEFYLTTRQWWQRRSMRLAQIFHGLCLKIIIAFISLKL